MTVRLVDQFSTINLFAGVADVAGYDGDNGPATEAHLNQPSSVAVANDGGVYIADFYNNVIRKVVSSNITTVVGIGTGAGVGSGAYSGDGGPATAAELSGPLDVKLDAAGNIYISDFNNLVIRAVNTQGTTQTLFGVSIAAGNIATIAGQQGSFGSNGPAGPALSAALGANSSIALDSAGNMYLACSTANIISKIDPAGNISTYVGTGAGSWAGDGGLAIDAAISEPAGVCVDADDNLFIADYFNQVIRRVDNVTKIITTIAGTPNAPGYNGDGGPATSAFMQNPNSVSVDPDGSLFFVDYGNIVVRRITKGGTISLVAGHPGVQGTNGDGGPALSAFIAPYTAVAVGASGIGVGGGTPSLKTGPVLIIN